MVLQGTIQDALCCFGRCVYNGPVRDIAWPILLYGIITLVLTFWQAGLYIRERRQAWRGFKLMTSIVIVMCVLQLAHYVAASLGSLYYIEHPNTSGLSSGPSEYPRWAIIVAFILTMSMQLVGFLSLHAAIWVYKGSRFFDDSRVYTGIMYVSILSTLYCCTVDIYSTLQSGAPLMHNIVSVLELDYWYSSTFQVLAFQLYKLQKTLSLKTDRAIRIVIPFLWTISYIRVAWVLYLCLGALPSKNWFSSYPRFFVSLTFMELFNNLFPAMLIFALRKHAVTCADDVSTR